MSEDQDWRLQAKLDVEDERGALDGVMGHFRPHRDEVVDDVQAAVAPDVVITHDGELLFAYASTEDALQAARRAIEDVLQRDGIEASIRVSVWDHELDAWRQIDPPPSAAQTAKEQTAERDAEAMQTRTLVASVGRIIRPSFEQSMRNWASELGIECSLIEHPHLLTTQVAFTIAGPSRKLDEFAQGLRAEASQTIRTEGNVLNPL
jgi:hypothetical protein